MKLVHVADLHLGYRAYHRTNAQGINIREADVARAFREVLERSRQLAPDFLLVAGDVFHTVRPSNAAIADAFRQFSRFCSDLPETRVVMIAGNHDSPRSAETGNILRLFGEIPGVQVVYDEPKRLEFPDAGVSVLCLPSNALLGETRPAIEPAPDADANILLAHALFESDRLKLVSGFGTAVLRRDDFDPADWSYVALGHYHLYEKLASNMYYPGGTERTSPNIWAEADQPKRFLEYDLDSGEVTVHDLESPRSVVDLEPIIGLEMSPAELDEAIASRVAGVAGGIKNKIVRLRLFDLPRDILRELDHRKMREYRTEALHFHLYLRPPQVVHREGSAAPGRRLTLQEELVAFLKHRWNPGSAKVDREALIELGLRYMADAEEAEALEGA